MLEKATIARPYSSAAFSQALDEGTLSEWSVFLRKLKLIVSDASMRKIIHHPKVSDELLVSCIIDICGEGVSQTQTNFVRTLIDAGRITLAPEISDLFELSKSAAEDMREVDVVSAYTLEQEQIESLSALIAKRLGKKIDMHTSEDNELIGGIVIRAGDAVLDASVRGRLKELTNLFAQ